MAVPTVSSITPNSGQTGGQRLVAISGTNFQLTPPPPSSGPAPIPNAPVKVLFGTVPADEVRVLSPTLLHAVTPIHDPGAVDVVVQNITQVGALIGAESVTVTGGYTFARPVLESKPSTECTLVRVVRAMIVELRRQVIDNVELTVNADYADVPGAVYVAMLSKIPGLVLAGPELRENRFYSLNAARSLSSGGSNSNRQRVPYTVDLIFTIIGADDSTIRNIALMSEVASFFKRNTVLRLERTFGVAGDYIRYELAMEKDGDLKPVGGPNNSNIRAFQGAFVIRGIDIDEEDMAILQTTELTDGVAFNAAQIVVGAAINSNFLQQIPPNEE